MNPNQLRMLSMYQAVLSHLDTKPAVWNTITPLSKSVFMFRTYVTALIQQTYLQPNHVSAIYVQGKDGQMRLMCDMALSLLLKIRSFAKATNNKSLLYTINYSENELRSGSELHIIKRCQTIHNKAKEFMADLALFEVTEESLVQLQEAITNVRPLITQKNAIASKRLAAMVNVPLLFEEARIELEKLDELVKTTLFDKLYIKSYLKVRNHSETLLNAVHNNDNELQLI
jgi:hypothetical protein